MTDLYPETKTRLLSVIHICIKCCIPIVMGHVDGLFVISFKFKAILKILLLGTSCLCAPVCTHVYQACAEREVI